MRSLQVSYRSVLPFVLLVGCGDGQRDADFGASVGGSASTTTSGGSASGGSIGVGGSSTQGGSSAVGGSASGGSAQGGSSPDGGSGGVPTVFPPGPPGCGLEHAAFCDTFDAPAGVTARAGELDPTKWSAARMCEIGGPSANGEAVAVGSATMPACRGGLPGSVMPNQDTLICDGNDQIQSNHLLTLVAAQNYGQNSYRIRQPFDFAEGPGTIVFDAEGYNVGNHGWLSLEVTEDPAPAPSFTIAQNFENGAIPRNAVELQFGLNCSGVCVGVYHAIEYVDFVQNVVFDGLNGGATVPTVQGKLHHFEVKLSATHLDVSATPASDDGVTFGDPVSLASADLNLPFTRGYVHLTVHNHATLKYSDGAIDAWTTRWDNVGFDGPAVTAGWRECEALDSLTPANSGKLNLGWQLANDTQTPAQSIEIKGVDPANAVSAQLALEHWSYHALGVEPAADFAINYRLNGHAWKTRTLTPSERAMLVDVDNGGTMSLLMDVEVADLVAGDNTLELTTSNAAPNAPPVALNIDLILKTD